MIENYIQGHDPHFGSNKDDLETQMEKNFIINNLEKQRQVKKIKDPLVYLQLKNMNKWVDKRKQVSIQLQQAASQVPDASKVTLDMFLPNTTQSRKSQKEIQEFANKLFSFWDKTKIDRIIVPHFINDVMSLGMAPSVEFVQELLLTAIPSDDIMKKQIRRSDMSKLVQGGRLIDKILDVLNDEVRKEK